MSLRLIGGTLHGKRSPLATFSETLYADATLADGARLEQAKADWRDGKFPTVPGETELIPLPAD